MTTHSPPHRHASSLFSHHRRQRSTSYTSTRSSLSSGQQPPGSPVNFPIFQGTSAVPLHHTVALSTVLDIHRSFEETSRQNLSPYSSTSSSSQARPLSSSSSVSGDASVFGIDLEGAGNEDVEVRVFRYFLRLWDPEDTPPDRLLDALVEQDKAQFERAAIRHFLRRIDLWEASGETSQESRRSFFHRKKRRTVVGDEGQVGEQEGDEDDRLKEVTTREGLAQLLWILIRDPKEGLDVEVKEECREALSKRYNSKLC